MLQKQLSVIVLLNVHTTPTNWLTDWLTGGWLSDWLTDFSAYQLTDQLTGWLVQLLTGWLTDYVADRLLDLLASSLTNWLDWVATYWDSCYEKALILIPSWCESRLLWLLIKMTDFSFQIRFVQQMCRDLKSQDIELISTTVSAYRLLCNSAINLIR